MRTTENMDDESRIPLPDPAAAPRPSGSRPLRVLVAAGPTHEPIDDVRYIGNRSSGLMGTAIASAFRDRGHAVTLTRGPGVAAISGCVDRQFVTAADLLSVLRTEWPAHDLLVMAAAVADYRPANRVAGKMNREAGPITLALEPTEDILAGLAASRRPNQYVVGFALERPEDLERSATAKLIRKRADAIVANPLATMNAPDVDAKVIFADGRSASPGRSMPKPEFAAWLVNVLTAPTHLPTELHSRPLPP
jgi:phosphopantothenoylcysteine decarboxylase/phosphopantothenate--cysteine ligase